MAGQGTAALELLEEVPDLDLLLAPVGGGGLIAGCATAAKALRPGDPRRRRRARGGRRHPPVAARRASGCGSRCRARSPTASRPTSPASSRSRSTARLVDDVELVSDAEILAAMAFLFDRMKLVAEPSGASAVGALLAGRVARGRRSASA